TEFSSSGGYRRFHTSSDCVRRAEECPEWQRGRTVNPLAYAFVGSSPTSSTSLKIKENLKSCMARWGLFSCRMCCEPIPSIFNDLRGLPKTPRDMDATYAT